MPTLTAHNKATLLIERYNVSPADCAEAVWDMKDSERTEVVLRNLYMIMGKNLDRSSADSAVEIATACDITPLAFSAYEVALILAAAKDDFDLIERNVNAAHKHGEAHTVALLMAFVRLASLSS